MSDSAGERRAWVESVLGFRFATGGDRTAAGLGRRWQVARQAWQAASETVDAQISALRSALLATGDPELAEIAEYGLNAMTGDHKARLMIMLIELGDGTATAMRRSGPKALTLVKDFRAHIESDQRVAACDTNPAGVPVSIRATLGPALAGLEAALQAANAR